MHEPVSFLVSPELHDRSCMEAFPEKEKNKNKKESLENWDLFLVIGITLEIFLEVAAMCHFLLDFWPLCHKP